MVSRTRLSLLLACALGGAVLLSGCVGGSGVRERITVNGSTTILPIAEVSAELFEEETGEVRVFVSGVGSSAGIESVASGSAEIGTASRELKGEEEDLGLVKTVLAYDAIAVIVHPENPVEALSREETKAIFQGEITNWRDVGGPDMSIGIVNRDEASGTREAFSKIVLDGERFDPTAAILPGTGQVRSVVADSRGAIGYISLGFVTPEVKALAIESVVPTRGNVLDGSYPLQRDLNFFTDGEPTGATAEYIEFVLSDAVQLQVVEDAGFVPVTRESD